MLMFCLKQENFEAWKNALRSQDQQLIANMYSDSGASLIPSASKSAPAVDRMCLRSLFDEGCTSVLLLEDVTDMGVESYLHSGEFSVFADGREALIVQFTQAWRLIDGSWKIVHQHLSLAPMHSRESPDYVPSEPTSLDVSTNSTIDSDSDDIYTVAQVAICRVGSTSFE